jgi:hypothetical protein
MILKAYSIHDAVSQTFGTPMFFVSDAIAVRAFFIAANDENNAIAMTPADYRLYRVGEWDDRGEMKSEQPKLIAAATDAPAK